MTRLSKIQAKTALSFCTLFCLYSPFVFSQQVDTAWVRRYNGPGNAGEVAEALSLDTQGNIYVTGYAIGPQTPCDYLTIKYYPSGDTAWVRSFRTEGSGCNYASKLAVDLKGNVYVTGESWRSSTAFDYATVKYDSSGNQIWEARYNGPGNQSDVPSALVVDSMGNIYVTGLDFDSVTGTNYATVKYDSAGRQVWVARFDAEGSGFLRNNLALDKKGNAYVTGFAGTVKYDSFGQQVWIKPFKGSVIAIDDDDNLFVTGSDGTVKYDSSGSELWTGSLSGFDLAIDTQGNVLLAGANLDTINTFSYDYATIKYNPVGVLLWIQYYNGSGDGEDIPTAIVVDKLGNVFTTGKSYGIGTGSSDFATVKYGVNGNLKWVHRYDGPSNDWDWGTDMAVFESGNVYVTGRSDGVVGSYSDFLTIKFEFQELKGDLNLDGSLSAADVVLMLNCTFLGEPPPAAPAACDLNCDGKITPADVVILLLMVFASASPPC